MSPKIELYKPSLSFWLLFLWFSNSAKVQTEDENYKKGIELVLKQFQDVLKSKGVEEIKTVGETFDPELHEAVSSVQDDTKGEKEIVQEYRKGYKLGHKVIRHSMVVVAN